MTAIRRALTRLTRASQAHSTVHFHRGPHGEPTPCFNRTCSTPKLEL